MLIFAIVILYLGVGMCVMRPVLEKSTIENYLFGMLIWPVALIAVAIKLHRRGK